MQKSDYLLVQNKLNFTPTNLHGIGVIGVNLMLFLAGIALSRHSAPSNYVLSQLIFALFFNHCYLIVHECAHLSFLSSRKLNVVFGHLASIFAFLPFFSRQMEHAGHHLWVGNFNEPSTKRALKTFNVHNKVILTFLKIAWALWIPVFSINEHIQVWFGGFKAGVKNEKNKKIKNIFSTLFLLMNYIGFLALYPGALGVCIHFLPALYFYFILIEFFNLPHHLDSEIIESKKPNPFWEHEKFTKSFKPIPYVGELLFLNFNYHVGHHYYPSLPWPQLSNAHKEIAGAGSEPKELMSELAWHTSLRKEAI